MISDWKSLRTSARVIGGGLKDCGIASRDTSLGISVGISLGRSAARASASSASMSGMECEVACSDVSTESIVTDVATVLSASGFLPVTD